MTVTIYTDRYNGKQYRVKSNSVIVRQYPKGATIYSDGSSDMQYCETSMKTKSALNSWLQMMNFK